MKFSFIGQVAEEQRQLPPGVRFPVIFMCRMLEVTRQGYYEWKKRPVSAHDQKPDSANSAVSCSLLP